MRSRESLGGRKEGEDVNGTCCVCIEEQRLVKREMRIRWGGYIAFFGRCNKEIGYDRWAAA